MARPIVVTELVGGQVHDIDNTPSGSVQPLTRSTKEKFAEGGNSNMPRLSPRRGLGQDACVTSSIRQDFPTYDFPTYD